MPLRIPPADVAVPHTTEDHLNGFFRGAEAIGGYVNHSLTFELAELDGSISAETSVEKFFLANDRTPGPLLVKITPAPGGILHVAERFIPWVFEFDRDPDSGRRLEGRSAEDPREAMGNGLIFQFVALFGRQPITAFTLNLRLRDGDPRVRLERDIQQEEFLLEGGGLRYYLSFGWND